MTAAVKERPILMSAPMVRATLREIDPKTQTRRVVKNAPADADAVERQVAAPTSIDLAPGTPFWRFSLPDGMSRGFVCPYGDAGDRLWVRETFYVDDESDIKCYRADGDFAWRWKPSIFMPRALSRITLEITDVRVQRLQEISEDDAMAEGIRSDIIRATGDHPDLICYVSEPDDNHAYVRAREAFVTTWDHINGKRLGCAWSDNPFVWAVSFRRLDAR